MDNRTLFAAISCRDNQLSARIIAFTRMQSRCGLVILELKDNICEPQNGKVTAVGVIVKIILTRGPVINMKSAASCGYTDWRMA
ncbi:hypothetical protein ACFOEZ_18985 [Tianweitania populi]|uniref:hypothetical protein n=1 Tax=Tianweitania populi TaxID=1607949 RepID=UPI001672A6DD|nr:hypothetical protein [Tianweitania populi]